jgi:deoxyribonuclease V
MAAPVMQIPRLHSWNLERHEARALQTELAARVAPRSPAGFRPRTVATLDCQPLAGGVAMIGGVMVFELPSLRCLEQHHAIDPDPPPYVPGYLSFREAPVLLRALAKVRTKPDLFLCDGQGLAHPRRFGLACHVGIHLDRPTIGAAKSRLVGSHDEPGLERGATAPLCIAGEVVGVALRSRAGARPIYVSIGHRVTLRTAVRLILAMTGRFRVCEPLRAADRLVREVARRS